MGLLYAGNDSAGVYRKREVPLQVCCVLCVVCCVSGLKKMHIFPKQIEPPQWTVTA